jgi:sulfur-oxidizing protein SoxY
MEELDMPTRREMMARAGSVAAALAGLGLLPHAAQAAWSQAAFEAKTLADVMKALGGAMPVESKEVVLTGPEIAENGAVVPIAASSTAAGVRRIVLMVEKNPTMLAAVFELSEAVEPALSTRVKMAQSSNVFAVAITGDDRVLYAAKEIKVTLGGCGG